MGDHRANIKIEFSMYGHTRKADMWINWFPSPDVDQRIIDFFRDAYLEVCDEYDAICLKEEAKRQELAQEIAERAEYERLRAKFEDSAHGIKGEA